MLIIDAHSHLWLRQDTVLEGKPVRSLENGRSLFLGQTVQMLPPFMVDGRNSAEVFISNMDYAQVSAAVVVQEFIDGNQNTYLHEVQRRYPDRFLVSGFADFRKTGFSPEIKKVVEDGFKMISIPGHRLLLPEGRVCLTSPEMTDMFSFLESHGVILSLCLADDARQIAEARDVISSFPNLKIAIGHFGMVTTSSFRDQILLARNKNVMIESGGITWLFNSQFYPFKSAIKAIRQAADLVGMDKLMWGSDYPRTITAITYKMSYDFIVKSTELNNTDKTMFLGLNAKEFYGLDPDIELPYIKSMSE